MSKGETKIANILKKADIDYEREKSFKDLGQGKMRFDFYLPNLDGAPAVIEYNGEQHYQYIPAFFKNKTEWRQQQGRDMRKVSYCLAHDIPIYLIPYWELPSIQTFEQLIDEKFRATNRYSNFIALSDKIK